ncbi:MAG: class I tRNA ligase family protein [Deinococcales bacterium]
MARSAKGDGNALAPFVPHIAEEMWSRLGQANSVHASQ